MLAWLSVWSEVQSCIWPSWCHCHSLSLASVKSRLVLLLLYRLTRVVPDKGPLNVCVCVCYPAENVVLPTFAAAAPCCCSCAAIDPYLILPGPTASNLPHSTAVSAWERRMDRRTRYPFVGSALHAMQAVHRGLIGALRICFQCRDVGYFFDFMHCYCIKLCIRVIFLGRVGIPCRSRWPTNVLYGSGHHSLCFCLSATSCSRNGNKSPQPGNDKHCDVHYEFSAVFHFGMFLIR